METTWHFTPGGPPIHGCPDSIIANPPCTHTAVSHVAVPHAGTAVPWFTGLELLAMGAGLVLAAVWRPSR